MSDVFAPIELTEVQAAQRAWAAAVIASDVDALLSLYDFDVLLFKPTYASSIRTDRAGALSYFVGGNPSYPADHGFLHGGFTKITFESANGPRLEAGGLSAQDMGHYLFVNRNGMVC